MKMHSILLMAMLLLACLFLVGCGVPLGGQVTFLDRQSGTEARVSYEPETGARAEVRVTRESGK